MLRLKLFLLSFCLCIYNYSSAQNDSFEIKINLSNGIGEIMFLAIDTDFSQERPLSTVIDSVVVDSNVVHFKGKLDYSTNARIRFKGKRGNFNFIISNTSYEISMDAKRHWAAKFDVMSSEWDKLNNFVTQRNLIYDKMNAAYDSLMIAEDNKDKTLMDYYLTLNKDYMAEADQASVDFIKANPAAFGALIQFRSFLGLDKSEKRTVFQSLSEVNKKHPLGQRIYYDLFKKDSLRSEGNQLLPFQFLDEDSKKVNLEDYKGDYILVDFWATWCGPCIDQFENYIDFYLSNQERNFEIIAISLDKNIQKWKFFLSENEYPWINLLDQKDGKGWLFFDYYGSRRIPFNILLGKNGEILQLNATIEDIQRILDEN